MTVKCLLTLIFFGSSLGVKAQAMYTDSVLLDKMLHDQRVQYQEFLNANSLLYNGTEYKEQAFNTTSGQKPFFLSDDWIESSIVYDGNLYVHVDLQYDIVNNKIITHPFYSIVKMELIYDRIEKFTLGTHMFERLTDFSGNNEFYDRLVSGKMRLYALRKLQVSEELGSGKIVHVLNDKTKYFVLYNQRLTEVKGKKALYRILSINASKIRSEVGGRKPRISFELLAIKGVEYYNHNVGK